MLETDPYQEGWLILVKPLNSAKINQHFEQWYKEGKFVS